MDLVELGSIMPCTAAAPMRRATTFDQTFRSKGQIQDPIFALIFILCFIVFAIVPWVDLRDPPDGRVPKFGAIVPPSSSDIMVLVSWLISAAALLSILYFVLARTCTKQFVWITCLLHVLSGTGTAVYYYTEHQYAAGMISASFTLLYVCCLWLWRSRIPLAVLYLQFAIDIIRQHTSIYAVSIIGVLLNIGITAWWSVTLAVVHGKFSQDAVNAGVDQGISDDTRGSCSDVASGFYLVFLFFTVYWVTETVKNSTHTIICGIYAACYYGMAIPDGIPRHAALSATRRTLFFSFGSVAFGSLIVAIVQTFRQFMGGLKRPGTSLCCLTHYPLYVLGVASEMIQWLAEFFNKYCFVEIALSGKSYLGSAKDSWASMKERGVDALVHVLSPHPFCPSTRHCV